MRMSAKKLFFCLFANHLPVLEAFTNCWGRPAALMSGFEPGRQPELKEKRESRLDGWSKCLVRFIEYSDLHFYA